MHVYSPNVLTSNIVTSCSTNKQGVVIALHVFVVYGEIYGTYSKQTCHVFTVFRAICSWRRSGLQRL